MQLEIKKDAIEQAIQEHLDKAVREGVSYQVKRALDDALEEAVTPEVVKGFVDSAMEALTDPTIVQRIVTEMNQAMGEAVRMTMQEAIVAVCVRLHGYRTNNLRSQEDVKRVDDLRQRLFPS